MIQHVERFPAELQLETLVQLPDLPDGSIPIVESKAAKNVPAHVSISSGGVRIENRSIDAETPSVGFQSCFQARIPINGSLTLGIGGIQQAETDSHPS